jgi:hypothetical protein
VWGEEKFVQVFGEEPEEKRPLERIVCKWEENIKMDFKVMELEVVDWTHRAAHRDKREGVFCTR